MISGGIENVSRGTKGIRNNLSGVIRKASGDIKNVSRGIRNRIFGCIKKVSGDIKNVPRFIKNVSESIESKKVLECTRVKMRQTCKNIHVWNNIVVLGIF